MTESQPVLWTAILALLYFAPSLVAYLRSIKTPQGPILLNIFLGWTILGWIAALIWAACAPVNEAQASQNRVQNNGALFQFGRMIGRVRNTLGSKS